MEGKFKFIQGMKSHYQHILIMLFLLLNIQLIAQEAKLNLKEGNEAYNNNEFIKAEELFRKSIQQKPEMIEGSFNLGDALYRQEKYEDASRYFNMAAERAEDKELKAKAYHNLGNSYIKEKKYEQSIEAYKKALINNPKDEDTRFNLAYAMQQLKKQQEQQKKEEEQKQEQEQKEEQQEEQEQEEQEQEQEEQQEEEQQEQEEQKQEEQEQQQEQQPKPNEVSREDAERILDALNNQEKEVQEELKKRELKKSEINIEKDW